MTTTEIGRLLGMSRQGAQQLSVRARDFPRPIGKLDNGWLWWRPEIEEWASNRERPNDVSSA
ncbi:MAG TPA: hypothetical protein VIM33_04960 [Gaiellaceae bacterium]|jgi:predicted DNA-binding transcriptional regulator AlpA